VGNQQMMLEASIGTGLFTTASNRSTNGHTELLVAVDSRLEGYLEISDTVRPTSADAVASMKTLGLTVHLLSGDRPDSANAVANSIGVDHVVAGVLPHQKVDEIRRLQQSVRVVTMLGDGINDAPAIAQADVGMSMPSGTDIAVEASDISLMRADLRAVPVAIALSRRTMRTIKQNLFWAFVYNVVGIPIAAGIVYPLTGTMLSPIIASAAMAFSSISVVANSLRLRTVKLHGSRSA
jgi:P-type Cu+ transporter